MTFNLDKLIENNFYELYLNIFEELNNDEIILLINFPNFNILNFFSHIIKKKNINIYFLNNQYEKLDLEMRGEECYSNINFSYKEIIDLQKDYIKFHKIILFSIETIDNFKNFIERSNYLLNNNGNIIIYQSLSNEKKNIINYKNTIRESINTYFNINTGRLFNFTNILEIIDDNKNIKTKSINILKKTNYIFYGDNIKYEIILELR